MAIPAGRGTRYPVSTILGVALILVPTSSGATISGPAEADADFGDTLQPHFQLGWRNGTDSYGRNDHLVPHDDFDGSYLDPMLWDVNRSSHTNASIKNGSLQFDHDGASLAPSTTVAKFRASLRTDFDMQVRFDLVWWPPANGGFVELGAVAAGSVSVFRLARSFQFGIDGFYGDDNGSANVYPASISTSWLRLRRTSGSVEGLFWEPGPNVWRSVFVSSAPSNIPLAPYLAGGNLTSWGDTEAFAASLDGFRTTGPIALEQFVDPGSGEVRDAVRLLPLADNFDDGTPNEDRWTTTTQGPMTVIESATGTLQFSCPGGAGQDPTATVVHRELIDGDLDVRMDFNVTTGPSADDWYIGLRGEVPGVGYVMMTRAYLSVLGGNVHFGFGTGAPGSFSSTAITEGGLRVVRNGGTMSGMYLGPSGWVTQFSAPAIAGPMRIDILARSGSTRPAFTVHVDDFRFATARGASPAGYAGSTFESRVLDTGETAPGYPVWGNLFFNASTNANTSVRFQLASSDSVGGPWSFRGPDGTAGTWYTSAGAAITGLTNGDRYVRYRAGFNSTNGTQSPVVWDVTVTATGPTIPELSGIHSALLACGLAIVVAVTQRRRHDLRERVIGGLRDHQRQHGSPA